jgi:hypothetical protein
MRKAGKQECFALLFSCLPAFLIFKPWNEKLLMRKAGNQECFAHLFLLSLFSNHGMKSY